MKHIVKRAGHSETYDVRKLYASIYAACLSVREHPGSAELIADEVVKEVAKWLERKHEVTSNDIRRQAAKHLKAINPDAGHIYLHHRVIW
jgi:transcriptional regulator NrdR family protein